MNLPRTKDELNAYIYLQRLVDLEIRYWNLEDKSTQSAINIRKVLDDKQDEFLKLMN